VKPPKAWVAESTPQGVCGAVDLSRFEPEKSGNLVFWKFATRKAISNPNASFLGLQCKDLEQSEYLWDWRSVQNGISCDFVEFSVR
jgi:hypothetical protein